MVMSSCVVIVQPVACVVSWVGVGVLAEIVVALVVHKPATVSGLCSVCPTALNILHSTVTESKKKPTHVDCPAV